ncbi:MAG TPA: hypothetical protein VFD75_13535 [Pyrinomonadaceae bacterium]|jgi:hypothetical protein|nr:hypothetical protein [Pyrinomonadaceae bacterium]
MKLPGRLLFPLSYPRTSAIICALFSVVMAVTASAQRGGKAEPNRIEFKRGTSTTTISDAVHNDEQAEYVLSARQGQRLTIKLTNVPAKSSCFDLKGPDGVDVGLEYDCNWNYSKVLPATGDYFLTLSRPSTAKGTSHYKMTVTVR